MLNDNSPISFSDPLPSVVDVVVIGGGVIGISTAWFLCQQGISVLVCEKGRVAGEQSSRNWGWIRQQGRDEAELPIVMESINLWESLSKQLDQDIGFVRCGIMYLADSYKDMEKHQAWLKTAEQHQLDSRLLSREELAAHFSGYRPEYWIGALYTPSDARAEPFLAVPALARTSQSMGVNIIEACAVRTLETSAGKVSGVVTEHGEIKCSAVVCAGGIWTSRFARSVNVDMPQLTVKSFVARTEPSSGFFDRNAASSEISFRRRQDGGYTLALTDYQEHFLSAESFRYLKTFLPALKSSFSKVKLKFGDGLISSLKSPSHRGSSDITLFEQQRVTNPPSNKSVEARLRARIKQYLPPLSDVTFAESWAGMIDATPDFVPVMDESPLKGFYLASGFSGHGFGIGPAAGRIMADLVQGNGVGHDLSRFRFKRFSDGSPLVLGPLI